MNKRYRKGVWKEGGYRTLLFMLWLPFSDFCSSVAIVYKWFCFSALNCLYKIILHLPPPLGIISLSRDEVEPQREKLLVQYLPGGRAGGHVELYWTPENCFLEVVLNFKYLPLLRSRTTLEKMSNSKGQTTPASPNIQIPISLALIYP